MLALEQLVAAMQGEVITALPAAAQAEQHATDAETQCAANEPSPCSQTLFTKRPQ